MSVRHLDAFFAPASIALFGDFSGPDALACRVLENLRAGGFAGTILLCSRKQKDYAGEPCFTRVRDLPKLPDLSIICIAPNDVPKLLASLGRKGAKAALVLSGGLSRAHTRSEKSLRKSIREVIRQYGIRVLGPNSIGVIAPGAKLNASSSTLGVSPGRIAYVGYSGVLGAAMLDWAYGRGVGFSHFLTIGDQFDVDLADLLNYLAEQPVVRSIILQLERIDPARPLLAALRTVARGKLVMVIKSGRSLSAARPQDLPPGLPDGDGVVSAALRRAGALRLESLDAVYTATEGMTRMRTLYGEHLAIISNGYGPAVVATDQLQVRRGYLATLSETSITALREELGKYWDGGNPVDLDAEADPARFVTALRILDRDPGVDAVLVLHAPTYAAPSMTAAEAMIEAVPRLNKSVICSWMGKETAAPARRALEQADIPCYETPGRAVNAFMYMVQRGRSLNELSETPPLRLEPGRPNRREVLRVVHDALGKKRDYLLPAEIVLVLENYGIEYAAAEFAPNLDAAQEAAAEIGFPVAVRVLHEAGCRAFRGSAAHGFTYDPVAMDVRNAPQLEFQATSLGEQVAHLWPKSRVFGFEVQRMRRGLNSLKAGVGVTRDPHFGPVIFIGSGGTAAEVVRDVRIGLPPLNVNLARDMVMGTRVADALAERGEEGEKSLQALVDLLVHVSDLVVDVPRIRLLELRPLVINHLGICVLRANMELGEPGELAIRAYPEELEQAAQTKSGRPVLLRPIRGEDEPAHQRFHEQLSEQTVYYRFFQYRARLTHRDLARMTQIDYDREMAFVAVATDDPGETLGVVRSRADADQEKAEFAVVVRDDLQGEGLGKLLLGKMIDYCRGRGVRELFGDVLAENEGMQGLATHMGFRTEPGEDETTVRVRLDLGS